MDAANSRARNSLLALVLGDRETPEFRAPLDLLQSLVETVFFADADQALRWMAIENEDRSPDLLVVVQVRPGTVQTHDLAALRNAAPLCRIVALLGNWCEGETRTGHPWAAHDRIYWYDWPWRIRREIELLGRGICPIWGLPETATMDERLIWSCRDPLPQGTGTVVIAASSRESNEVLTKACHFGGYDSADLPWMRQGAKWLASINAVCRKRQAGHVVAAIWEAGKCDATEALAIGRFCGRLPAVRVLAVVDFPTILIRRRLLDAGAGDVLGKPLLIEDLLAALGAG
jgi:hypothetical protein